MIPILDKLVRYLYFYIAVCQHDVEDTTNNEVMSLKEAAQPNSPHEVEDKGIVPGDRRGAAGYDSSLFV